MERPISLLYVATVPAPLRNFYIPYAHHFRKAGWRVAAAANGASHVRALTDAFDVVYDVPFSRSIRSIGAHAASAREIRKRLSGYDIVHVHTPIAAFVARASARAISPEVRPRVTYTAHGFHFHHDGNAIANALYLTAEKIAGRWTDRLVVINDEDFAAARAARLVKTAQLVRMAGVGVDTAWYSRDAVTLESQAEARAALGIGLEAPVFVVVGELHPNKRQADALDALAVMRNWSAHLVLLGEGRERRQLEARSRELGIERRVHMPGFVDDPRPFVATAAGLVLPSAREGLSRSIMEALAMQVPVVASTARGNRELLGDDAGLVVPTGDYRGLAAAMDSLIEEPDLARSMGRAGRARMTAEYELGTVIRRHEQMYLSMLGRVPRLS